MELLDKLLAAFKPKQEAPAAQETPAQPEAPAEAQPSQEGTPEAAVDAPNEDNSAAIAEMAAQLEGFVYDPELASELAPAFVAMSAVEGFDKVMELFAAKEKQIEALNVGGTEQQSTPEVQEKPEDDKPKAPSATDILRERATAQRK